MNAQFIFISYGARASRCVKNILRGGNSTVLVLLAFAGLALPCLAGGFVYETSAEFISNGDFDGDGRLDVVVLDKQTGNVRVGYQDANGALQWSEPLATGVSSANAFAVGRFLQSDRDAIAVSSLQLNSVQLLDVSSPGSTPIALNPTGIGPNLLVSLTAPFGVVGDFDFLTVGTGYNDPGLGTALLDLFAFTGDSLGHYQDQIADDAYLASGNSVKLGTGAMTFAAAMQRGTSNDTFAAYSYADHTNRLYRVGLYSGTEYAFGNFTWGRDNDTAPGFLFYVPGQSNIIAQRIVAAEGTFAFGAPTTTTFASAIQRVFYIDEGADGFAVVQFGDGVVGVRLSGSNDELQVSYHLGQGAAGNVITGFVPLGSGKFAMLSGASNTLSSAQAQVFTKSGSNYVQTSSSSLTRTSANATRANVWLFANEPFVNANPVFIGSLHGGDWITSVTGLPGAVSVVAEMDRGVTNGLGNPAAQNFSSPSLNAAYGIANQYHPAISLFTYSGVRAAEPVLITISPPPGAYESPISISFTKANVADHVLYRLGAGTYQEYAAPFTLGTNSQVQFYGTTSDGSQRSSLQLASYTFSPKPDVLNTNANDSGSGTNSPPGPGVTNEVPTYAYGTVYYSRRSGSTGSIWAIHLDGSGDHYVTQGVRPRLSPEGRYLAFLREGDPFATVPVNSGNIWIRDLLTGDESRLITHTGLIVGFDWEYGYTNLVFDDGCGLFRTGLDGNRAAVAFAADCGDDAPAVSPLDGRLAFHNLNSPPNLGLYVTDPSVTAKQQIFTPGGTLKPRRLAWSPDGQQLAFAQYQFTFIPESGEDLYVMNADGTDLFQITGFRTVEGFREGALWTPDGGALVGAATIGGVNGIWVVQLTPDRHACGLPPFRLPTTPGDAIDFVGTVFVPPPPPKLFIRRESDEVVVSWRRTAWPYVLETTADPSPLSTWTAIPAPYNVNGTDFELHIPAANLESAEFFRLHP